MAPLPFLQRAQRVADWLSPAHESKDVRSLSHLSLEISSLTPLCSLRLPSHKPLSFLRLTNAASMSSCAVIPLCRCVCRLWGSGQSHLTSFEFDFFFKSTFSQMTVFTSFWWQISAAEMTWESVVFVPARCVRHSSTMLAIIEQPQHVIAGLFSLKNSMEW